VLRCISKSVRVRAASMIVALYTFCLVAPSVAFALDAAHCLTDDNHHRAASTHVHADGTVHVHAAGAAHEHATATDQQDQEGATDQTGHMQNCCGLACVSAIAPVVQADLFDQVRFTTVAVLIADEVPGRSPDQLYRPPISL
jgi:hypothetical protein